MSKIKSSKSPKISSKKSTSNNNVIDTSFLKLLHDELINKIYTILKVQNFESIHNEHYNLENEYRARANEIFSKKLNETILDLKLHDSEYKDENSYLLSAYSQLSVKLTNELDNLLFFSKNSPYSLQNTKQKKIEHENLVNDNNKLLNYISINNTNLNSINAYNNIIVKKNEVLLTILNKLILKLNDNYNIINNLNKNYIEFILKNVHYRNSIKNCNNNISNIIKKKLGYIPTSIISIIEEINNQDPFIIHNKMSQNEKNNSNNINQLRHSFSSFPTKSSKDFNSIKQNFVSPSCNSSPRESENASITDSSFSPCKNSIPHFDSSFLKEQFKQIKNLLNDPIKEDIDNFLNEGSTPTYNKVSNLETIPFTSSTESTSSSSDVDENKELTSSLISHSNTRSTSKFPCFSPTYSINSSSSLSKNSFSFNKPLSPHIPIDKINELNQDDRIKKLLKLIKKDSNYSSIITKDIEEELTRILT